MSVRSVKTAVTCEKPLRDSDRVLSRPGAPASAVSIGKVICFSISTGESGGAIVLICTCLLVTSGTASMGSFVSAKAPRHATKRPSTRTTQRRRMAISMITSIMSVLVLRFAFLQFRLQNESIGDRVYLAGFKAADDRDILVILLARTDRPRFEAFGVAYKQRRDAFDGL